jgi:hypothetical protein
MRLCNDSLVLLLVLGQASVCITARIASQHEIATRNHGRNDRLPGSESVMAGPFCLVQPAAFCHCQAKPTKYRNFPSGSGI